MSRSHEGEASSDPLSAIDYFGPGATSGAQSRSTGQEEDGGEEEYEEDSDSEDSGAGEKRKRKDEERNTSKKKMKNKQAEVEGKVDVWIIVVDQIRNLKTI